MDLAEVPCSLIPLFRNPISRIPAASVVVAYHVHTARQRMSLSTLSKTGVSRWAMIDIEKSLSILLIMIKGFGGKGKADM